MMFSYKKELAIGHQCIPSAVSLRVAADMNLAFTLSCMMAVMWILCGKCETASELVSNSHRRFHKRPLLRGFALEDLIDEEDDNLDMHKRQQFDDYGHMRFGKREQFDDYGHMRFGRNHQ